MAECSSCEEQIELESISPCSYCNNPFCSEHRLPEQHECVGLPTTTRFGDESEILAPGESVTIGDRQTSEGSTAPAKTPCEECGRPSPADDTFCSPCQADMESKQTTATREEIADHWRKNGDLSPQDSSGTSTRWILVSLGALVAIGFAAAWIFGLV